MVALAVHGILEPIKAEYRKLDAAPVCDRQHADDHKYDVASTTAVVTERGAAWDHDKRPPERAFGFGRPDLP